VLELSSHGNSQPEISRTLQISIGTGLYQTTSAGESKDSHSRQTTEEYQNCMVGINQVLKICWEIVNKSRNINSDNGDCYCD
jgi:hypothetical protein